MRRAGETHVDEDRNADVGGLSGGNGAQAPRHGLRRDPLWFLTGDVLVLIVSAAIAGAAPVWAATYLLIAVIILGRLGFYRPRLTLRVLPQVPTLSASTAGSLLLLIPAILVGGTLSTPMIATAGISAVGLPAGRALTYAIVRRLRQSPNHRERVMIVGSGKLGHELADLLAQRPEHGLTPVGFIESDVTLPAPTGVQEPLPTLGTLSDLPRLLGELGICRLIVAFGVTREAEMVTLMRSAIAADVEVHMVPRFFEVGVSLSGSSVDQIWGIPLHRVRKSALRHGAWRFKRVFDIVLCAIGAVFTVPLLVGGALLARHASGGGSILFRQERIGQHGEPFELLKFRSLPVTHEGDSTWTVGAQPDLPWSARLMRRSSVDELPQLWNVLRGNMSLVGPRPERPNFVSEFSEYVPGYGDRHRLPVGLTGWAQVNGLRGDTSIPERARFDNAYVENWSPLLDVTILLRTFGAVLRELAGLTRSRISTRSVSE